MLVTKLEALLDEEEFAADTISTDVGLLITENDVIHYLIVEFFTVYLNLFEEAKAIMNELMYG